MATIEWLDYDPTRATPKRGAEVPEVALEPLDYNPLKPESKTRAKAGDGYTPPFGMQTMGNIGAGLARGAGGVVSTLIDVGKAAAGVAKGEGWNYQEDAGRRKAMDDVFASAGVEPDSAAYKVGKVGGEVAATWPIGGIFGKAATLAGAPALGEALATGGMKAADVVGPGVAQGAKNLLLRSIGGAVTGGASAALVNPHDAVAGAAIGGSLPVVGRVAGAGAETASALLRPFTAKGQDRITGNVLREFATDPEAARAALQATREIVPGSAPTSAMAAGDTGLAALSRAMQNANPEYASSLAARTTAQNQADLNAGQLVNNAGRAVGSNTLQNMAQNQILQSALGKTLGGSVPMQTTVGRLMQLPYGTANKQLQEKLSAAMLDPETAAKLLTQPQAFSRPRNALLGGVAPAAYRFPPLLAAQD